MTNSISDIEEADTIFVIGSNTTEGHPVIGSQIKRVVKYRGVPLIVADPRRIELTRYATIHLRHACGTDVALLNGLMHVILAEALYDKAFVAKRTQGFDELQSLLAAYTPELVERITGVSQTQLRHAARLYAQSNAAMIFYAMGITQHSTGTDNVKSVANLAMLTGNLGKPGAGVNPLRGQNNVQGACDMGALPNVFPGYQRVTDPEIRAKFERAWHTSLPDGAGLTLVEMMNAAHAGQVKGMFVIGENPVLSDPDANHVRSALRNMDFLVVQDIFLSETAELADVVLPAVSFAEKGGTVTNTERRVQLTRPAIRAIGQARTDGDILCDLAGRMGYPMSYDSSAEVMHELASLTPIYGGMTHDRVADKGLQWPCPSLDHPGTPYLHKDRFTQGLGKFHAVEYLEAKELPDDQYPFLLTTGRLLYHWHTGTMSRRAKALHEIAPEGYVEIHPEDAQVLGVDSDEWVHVASRRGEVTVRVCVAEIVPQGTVFMSFHFREAAANLLTHAALDPMSKIPEYKVCAVSIQKATR